MLGYHYLITIIVLRIRRGSGGIFVLLTILSEDDQQLLLRGIANILNSCLICV
jgi:hypothetical protein